MLQRPLLNMPIPFPVEATLVLSTVIEIAALIVTSQTTPTTALLCPVSTYFHHWSTRVTQKKSCEPLRLRVFSYSGIYNKHPPSLRRIVHDLREKREYPFPAERPPMNDLLRQCSKVSSLPACIMGRRLNVTVVTETPPS